MSPTDGVIYPVGEDSFAEYNRLRIECGYDADRGMVESVWSNCTDKAQADMLQQYRDMAHANAEHLKSRAHYGEVW